MSIISFVFNIFEEDVSHFELSVFAQAKNLYWFWISLMFL
jgi:hypothetical protein